MTYALWIVQGLLALIFLFTGGMKLVLPLKVLTAQMPLPGIGIPMDDEAWEYVTDLLSMVDATLLGRVNYQEF